MIRKIIAFLALMLVVGICVHAETVSEEEAWKLGWPTMQNPYGNYRVPQARVKLVEDLSKARLVWESETMDCEKITDPAF